MWRGFCMWRKVIFMLLLPGLLIPAPAFALGLAELSPHYSLLLQSAREPAALQDNTDLSRRQQTSPVGNDAGAIAAGPDSGSPSRAELQQRVEMLEQQLLLALQQAQQQTRQQTQQIQALKEAQLAMLQAQLAVLSEQIAVLTAQLNTGARSSAQTPLEQTSPAQTSPAQKAVPDTPADNPTGGQAAPPKQPPVPFSELALALLEQGGVWLQTRFEQLVQWSSALYAEMAEWLQPLFEQLPDYALYALSGLFALVLLSGVLLWRGRASLQQARAAYNVDDDFFDDFSGDSARASSAVVAAGRGAAELTDAAMEQHESLMFATDEDAAASKLDLARAYIDMDDMAGARGLLQQVLRDGSEQQQRDARALLDTIG